MYSLWATNLMYYNSIYQSHEFVKLCICTDARVFGSNNKEWQCIFAAGRSSFHIHLTENFFFPHKHCKSQNVRDFIEVMFHILRTCHGIVKAAGEVTHIVDAFSHNRLYRILMCTMEHDPKGHAVLVLLLPSSAKPTNEALAWLRFTNADYFPPRKIVFRSLEILHEGWKLVFQCLQFSFQAHVLLHPLI